MSTLGALAEIDIARASPIAIIAVVDAVGARFRGQASRGIATETSTSAVRATDDSGEPVMAIVRISRRRANSSSRTTSGVSPEYESASTTSPGISMPRSPWLASPACRK